MRGWLCVIAFAACQGSPAPESPPSGSATVAAASVAEVRDADVVRTTKAGAVTYTYRASKMTYLVYVLDCLADVVPCSGPAIQRAWNEGWTLDDDKAVHAWKELRQRYSGMIVDGTRTSTAVLPVPYHDRDVGTAVRVASFGARDIADAGSRLSLFLGAAEVAQATAIFEHFAKRLDQRWRDARASLVANLDDYVALGERTDVRALLEQIASFYAIGAGGAHQTFDLVSRPVDKGPTSAQQLGELAVVETVPGEKASQRYPVVAHEMFHAWFGASPLEAQAKLVDRFIATDDPLAGPAWGLLDEVLATALGNGLVAKLVDPQDYERRLKMDNGFYNDTWIDKVAKALLPALEKRLAANGSVYDDGFVADYFAAVHAAFPDGLPPITYLRPLFVAVPATPHSDTLIRRSNAGYVESYSTIEEAIANAKRLQGWGTVIFSKKSELDRLAPFLPPAALAAARRESAKSFVFAYKRKPVGTVFLFVADTTDELDRIVEYFLHLGPPLGEGVLLR
jgi:hypothetical protein